MKHPQAAADHSPDLQLIPFLYNLGPVGWVFRQQCYTPIDLSQSLDQGLAVSPPSLRSMFRSR